MDNKELMAFIKNYAELGGNVSDTAIRFIKEDIKSNSINAKELDIALKKSHSKERFMNWSTVMSYVRGENRVFDGGTF